MTIVFLMFLCALALSGVAAFYSVAGLIAIFAAAPLPIAIMGSILEGSKLVIASWLYRNWNDIPGLMKGYFVTSLVVLMFLTSMGIFGFLSKAHIEQGTPTGNIVAQIQIIDDKIKVEKDNVDAARKTIAQLDLQVTEAITRTAKDTTNAGINRSVTIRRQQAKERQTLASQIESSQSAIAQLTSEKAPLASSLRQIEAEVGPIKYIASLIYGNETAKDSVFLEKAVQWVTILIVAVFDPLAVIMLIAANWSLAKLNKQHQVEVGRRSSPPRSSEPMENRVEPMGPSFEPTDGIQDNAPSLEKQSFQVHINDCASVHDKFQSRVTMANSMPVDHNSSATLQSTKWNSRPNV